MDTMIRSALKEITDLVKKRTIVICRSDKDGKIVIVDYDDYNHVMERELSKFNLIQELNANNINKHFENIRKECEDKIKTLHREGFIDDNELRHIVGMKFDEQKRYYYRIPGPIAKHFVCNKAAYAYPLFKTHKLDIEALKSTSVDCIDIPIRLLQSAGNITTTKITAFLESVLNPISIRFCNYKLRNTAKTAKRILNRCMTGK